MKFSKLTERISQLGSDKWLVHLEARKLKKNNPNILSKSLFFVILNHSKLVTKKIKLKKNIKEKDP